MDAKRLRVSFLYSFFLLFSYSKQNVGCVGCALPEEGDFIPFFFILFSFYYHVNEPVGSTFFLSSSSLVSLREKKASSTCMYPVDNNVSKLFFIFFLKKKRTEKNFSDIFLLHSISSCVYTAVCNLSRLLSED